MRMVHKCLGEGGFLHFQGDNPIIGHGFFRISALVISLTTAIYYVTQYAVVKQAANFEAIFWLAAQAALALICVIFWLRNLDLTTIIMDQMLGMHRFTTLFLRN